VQLQVLEAMRDILHANPENTNTFTQIGALKRLLDLAMTHSFDVQVPKPQSRNPNP
jgi:hypothetical protein